MPSLMHRLRGLTLDNFSSDYFFVSRVWDGNVVANSLKYQPEKLANSRWFLIFYYVPELSSLLSTIGAKLIVPHGGLQVSK